MNKKGSFGNFVIGFIGIIVALTLLPAIAVNQSNLVDKIAVSDEEVDISSAVLSAGAINESTTFTLTNAPSGWKTSDTDCYISSYTFSNSSTDFAETTDYVITANAGTFTLKNTTATLTMIGDDNTTYADYSYCLDGYIPDRSGRAVANLLVLISAIALLGFSVWFFYRGWKNR